MRALTPSLANLKSALAGASAALLAATLAAPACSSSSGGPCAAQGHCPADKARTGQMVDDCNALLGDPACGPKYGAAIQCFNDHEQCDTAGNADANATMQACAAPYAAWMACEAAPDAGGG